MSTYHVMTAHAGMPVAEYRNAIAAGEDPDSRRDGQRRFVGNSGGNHGAGPFHQPDDFGGMLDDPACCEPPLKVSRDADRYDPCKGNDDSTRAGNLVGAMKPVPPGNPGAPDRPLPTCRSGRCSRVAAGLASISGTSSARPRSNPPAPRGAGILMRRWL